LSVDNVGKAYYEFGSELARFARWIGYPAKPRREHWVLRHVSLQLRAGESVGIIGQNGAGKSTLLKLVTGTTRPNEGGVALQGRVAALLELGLGFNAELTGRQNVRHVGGLMGLSAAAITSLMAEIEDFAEIGEYFDQPVRMYSSGMQMRVAFSVATAVRPDILIVDEALAVGDAYFVHKCFQRIRQFRDDGTTLMIVSHDPSAIQALCDRAILLDGGRLILDGPPQEVMDYYNAMVAQKENASVRTTSVDDGRIATESGTGEAVFQALQLRDEDGRAVEYVGVNQPVKLWARVRAAADIPRLVFGYMIRDRLGQPIFGTNTDYFGPVVHDLRAGDVVDFEVSFDANLGPGTYSLSVALSSTETHLVRNYQWRDLALVFTAANMDKPTFVGSAWIPPVFRVVRDPPNAASGSLPQGKTEESA
jgi:lipopolysaccharide transport system ATP-binding protein